MNVLKYKLFFKKTIDKLKYRTIIEKSQIFSK